jgi:hypothetical protein
MPVVSKSSVVDSDPYREGSDTFCRIGIQMATVPMIVLKNFSVNGQQLFIKLKLMSTFCPFIFDFENTVWFNLKGWIRIRKNTDSFGSTKLSKKSFIFGVQIRRNSTLTCHAHDPKKTPAEIFVPFLCRPKRSFSTT